MLPLFGGPDCRYSRELLGDGRSDTGRQDPGVDPLGGGPLGCDQASGMPFLEPVAGGAITDLQGRSYLGGAERAMAFI